MTARGFWLRVKVGPETCTVLGQRGKADSPLWTGLNLALAEPRIQSTIMMAMVGDDAPLDPHLNVPWCHPEDQTGTDEDWTDCIYRVRPIAEAGRRWRRRMVQSVHFERWNGTWFVAVQFAQPKRARPAPAVCMQAAP